MKPQTIVSLRAENTKRLSVVEINADGQDVVIVGGRNGQGKSSVLDSIEMAFAGKRAMPDEPIRQGTDRAVIVARTQDYIVERRITPGGQTVKVTAADGSKLSSPQKVLDQILSDIAFDPMAFINAKPKAQAATLAEVVGIDIDAAAAKRAEIFNDRTVVNRRVKEMEAQAKPVDPEAPAEEVSISELMRQIQEGERQVRAMEDHHAQMIQVQREIADLQDRLSALLQREQDLSAYADGMPDPNGMLPELRSRLEDAERLNALARERIAQEQLAANVAGARSRAEELTKALEAHDAAQAKALAESKLPVEGLGFTADGVSLNGIPLAQASTAEQLRVSVALALAQSPGLRVAMIKDGSLLDRDSLALVAQMAAEAGAQCWIERVGDGEEVSVVIEDGTVAENRLEPVADSEPEAVAEVADDPVDELPDLVEAEAGTVDIDNINDFF
jgi:predicted ATPase